MRSCIRHRRQTGKIGLDVYCLAIWIVCAFLLKYLVPLPVPEKEASVAAILMSYLVTGRRMRMRNCRVWLCVSLILYYGLDAIWKEGLRQGITSGIAMISWWMCLLICLLVDRNEDEIRLILNVLKWSCFLCALLIIAMNPPFSGAEAIRVGRIGVNRNEAVERVLPGLLIHLIQISRGGKIRASEYLMAALMLYACLLPNSRGGFLSLALTLGMILLAVNARFRSQHGGHLSGKMLLGLLVSLTVLYIILPEEFTSRLWQIDEWSLDDTGRLTLWRDGIAMVTDPLFGMGPGYYELHSSSKWRAYGVHNMFIDIYIAAGIIAFVLIVILFLTFVRKDYLALAFLAMPLVRTMVEAGRSYGTWMILALLGIILNYCDQNKLTVLEFFNRLYARRDDGQAAEARMSCIKSVQKDGKKMLWKG